MKQDQFQAEVLARFELLDKRLNQVDKAVRDLQSHVDMGNNELQDQIVNLGHGLCPGRDPPGGEGLIESAPWGRAQGPAPAGAHHP